VDAVVGMQVVKGDSHLCDPFERQILIYWALIDFISHRFALKMNIGKLTVDELE